VAAAAAAAAATPGSGVRATPPRGKAVRPLTEEDTEALEAEEDNVLRDTRDLSWSAVMKRTVESYIRGERPNMYGEWLEW